MPALWRKRNMPRCARPPGGVPRRRTNDLPGEALPPESYGLRNVWLYGPAKDHHSDNVPEGNYLRCSPANLSSRIVSFRRRSCPVKMSASSAFAYMPRSVLVQRQQGLRLQLYLGG